MKEPSSALTTTTDEELKSNEMSMSTCSLRQSVVRESEKGVRHSELIEDEEDVMEPNAYVERDPKDILLHLKEYCKK